MCAKLHVKKKSKATVWAQPKAKATTKAEADAQARVCGTSEASPMVAWIWTDQHMLLQWFRSPAGGSLVIRPKIGDAEGFGDMDMLPLCHLLAEPASEEKLDPLEQLESSAIGNRLYTYTYIYVYTGI